MALQVSQDEQLREYKLLVPSFPYSNAAYVYPVPRENQECFLEGLKQIFEQIGGVPRRIWFDNLSAAVVTIGTEGNRQCTDAFLRFQIHYCFESVFCDPARGNEKGHVENKVGYVRRNWCVPLPIFTTHEALATSLIQQAERDMDRPHHSKQTLIQQLWQEEKPRSMNDH
ncbi:DDE-type integrase/transposase/recombinase [Heliophilum fasciatum]|uniref:Integrase-like protein n=1 Tax=Heliophilum fasciatum TaxID=35700 RepID=A0A4R2RD70_9FIRM|nr:DDE-type integrase/transposase/recombinase [Heliophilum fasciatum]MCW2279315.1 transposase [Heliophilum fasciatum]TCP60424.1 integrase-like protein [Heliophilum fasciatum]